MQPQYNNVEAVPHFMILSLRNMQGIALGKVCKKIVFSPCTLRHCNSMNMCLKGKTYDTSGRDFSTKKNFSTYLWTHFRVHVGLPACCLMYNKILMKLIFVGGGPGPLCFISFLHFCVSFFSLDNLYATTRRCVVILIEMLCKDRGSVPLDEKSCTLTYTYRA